MAYWDPHRKPRAGTVWRPGPAAAAEGRRRLARGSASGHFTPGLFPFLRQPKRNNTRERFQKNTGCYLEQVRAPMLAFIADFSPGTFLQNHLRFTACDFSVNGWESSR